MASYYTEVLADSPKALWRLDETSGNAADTSGNGHTATVNGSPTYRVTGPAAGIPWAVTIPASTAYFSIADHADFDLGNGPFSIEGWFKRGTTSDGGGILGKADGSASSGYIVTMSVTDFLRLETGDTSAHVYNNSATTLDNTSWHHFCFTRASATNAKLYIDGTNVTDLNTSKTFTDNNTSLLIGSGFGANNAYSGVTIAGIAIYKSELSSARVSAHYNARNTADATTVSAPAATATGTSRIPAPKVRPEAGQVAPTGIARGATVSVTGSASMANAGHASATVWASQGTGSDLDVAPDVVDITVSAETANKDISQRAPHLALTLDLPQHGWQVGPSAGDVASITSALALDAVAVTVAGTFATAQVASATVAANDASAGADVVTDAELANATTEAHAPVPKVIVRPAAATVTATATDALQAFANAQTVSATGAASDIDAMVAPAPVHIAQAGLAGAPSTSVAVHAGIATASVSAAAASLAVAMHPEVATAIGASLRPSWTLQANAGAALAIAEAYGLNRGIEANAEHASATGAAWDIDQKVAPSPAAIAVVMAALDPSMTRPGFAGVTARVVADPVATAGVVADTTGKAVLR